MDVVQVVTTMLAGQATLVPARSLREAQTLLAGERFNLVLLDIILPDGSGLDLMPQINQLMPAPPVIIFSATDVDADVLDTVASALVKSQTSNARLSETIARLIDRSTTGHEARPCTTAASDPL